MQATSPAPHHQRREPPPDGSPDEAPDRPDPLGRIVQIARHGRCLLAELRALDGRIEQARRHLADPGDNPVAPAHLDQLRAKHSAVLAFLRADRLEAHQILVGIGAWG